MFEKRCVRRWGFSQYWSEGQRICMCRRREADVCVRARPGHPWREAFSGRMIASCIVQVVRLSKRCYMCSARLCEVLRVALCGATHRCVCVWVHVYGAVVWKDVRARFASPGHLRNTIWAAQFGGGMCARAMRESGTTSGVSEPDTECVCSGGGGWRQLRLGSGLR